MLWNHWYLRFSIIKCNLVSAPPQDASSTVPAGVVFFGGGAAFSSSLLDSSLLEVSVLGFAFLADGPFAASALLEGAFRFLASGDLQETVTMLKT